MDPAFFEYLAQLDCSGLKVFAQMDTSGMGTLSPLASFADASGKLWPEALHAYGCGAELWNHTHLLVDLH